MLINSSFLSPFVFTVKYGPRAKEKEVDHAAALCEKAQRIKKTEVNGIIKLTLASFILAYCAQYTIR
jgi:hypothetical protein